eukprot:GEMP01018324.1.p1 GENE.GEMP01018324.1~~GEMP01018324.1.p1  ORF type:complete len:522 (+),score=105.63 GEMP01018324.1:328-1893(+)
MRRYGINWEPRVIALAIEEMKDQIHFQAFSESGPFVYFLEFYCRKISYMPRQFVLKAALEDLVNDPNTSQTADFVVEILQEYVKHADDIGNLCDKIMYEGRKYDLQPIAGARLFGRIFASLIVYVAARDVTFAENQAGWSPFLMRISRMFAKLYVSEFPEHPGAFAEKESVESNCIIRAEDGAILNAANTEIEQILLNYSQAKPSFSGPPSRNIGADPWTLYKTASEDDSYLKIRDFILAHAEEIGNALRNEDDTPPDEYPIEAPPAHWDCGQWMNLQPRWQSVFFFRWLNARAIANARKCQTLCKSGTRWTATENPFQKEFYDRKGVPCVLSSMGQGKYYSASPGVLIEVLATPAHRMGLDAYMVDMVHVETISDTFSDTQRPQGEVTVRRHEVFYCAWQVPEHISKYTDAVQRDSVIVLSIVEGLTVGGMRFDAVVCSSVLRPIPKVPGRVRCRIFHDDFLIAEGPEDNTSKVWRLQVANFKGQWSRACQSYWFLRPGDPFDGLTRMVTLATAAHDPLE